MEPTIDRERRLVWVDVVWTEMKTNRPIIPAKVCYSSSPFVALDVDPNRLYLCGVLFDANMPVA